MSVLSNQSVYLSAVFLSLSKDKSSFFFFAEQKTKRRLKSWPQQLYDHIIPATQVLRLAGAGPRVLMSNCMTLVI